MQPIPPAPSTPPNPLGGALPIDANHTPPVTATSASRVDHTPGPHPLPPKLGNALHVFRSWVADRKLLGLPPGSLRAYWDEGYAKPERLEDGPSRTPSLDDTVVVHSSVVSDGDVDDGDGHGVQNPDLLQSDVFDSYFRAWHLDWAHSGTPETSTRETQRPMSTPPGWAYSGPGFFAPTAVAGQWTLRMKLNRAGGSGQYPAISPTPIPRGGTGSDAV